MTTMSEQPEHRYDAGTERCVCGGAVVYYEHGDEFGDVGLGCEVTGRVFPAFEVTSRQDQDDDAT